MGEPVAAAQPVASSAIPAGAAPAAVDQAAELSMVLVRFAGEHAARQALAKSGSAIHQDQTAPQVELVIEANEHGRRRVINPTTGSAAFAKSDTISWGLFGLVWGVIVGFAGDGGVLGSLESGLVTGILWALFGLAAGALYGLWAGRGVSARRLKGLGPFVPPGTSLVLAWAAGPLSQETIERWAAPGSQRLILRLRQYETRHDQHRPHHSLHSAAPLKPLPQPVILGRHRVRRQTRAGGTINEYRLVA